MKNKRKKLRPLHDFTVVRKDGTPEPVFSVKAMNKQEAVRIMKKSAFSWWYQGAKVMMVPPRPSQS